MLRWFKCPKTTSRSPKQIARFCWEIKCIMSHGYDVTSADKAATYASKTAI